MKTKIEPLRNHVIFQFVEDVTSTRFVNSSTSGIIISAKDSNQSNLPRWGKVTHVGPEVDGVSIGEYALIESGMWTPGFYVDGVRYWKTDDTKIMGISDEPTTTY